MTFDDLLNFAKFDSEATNFDLFVVATKELDVAIELVAGKVTRFVKFVADVICERITVAVGNESFVSQILSVPVTKRYARSADEDFAFATNGDFVSVWIEDINLCVADRFSDQDWSRRACDLESG